MFRIRGGVIIVLEIGSYINSGSIATLNADAGSSSISRLSTSSSGDVTNGDT